MSSSVLDGDFTDGHDSVLLNTATTLCRTWQGEEPWSSLLVGSRRDSINEPGNMHFVVDMPLPPELLNRVTQ